MLRGIFTGLFFGGLLGLLLAGFVSLIAPLPATVTVSQSENSVPSEPETPAGTSLSDTSSTDAPVQADPVAQSPALVDGADGAPAADLQSAPKPAPAAVEDAPDAPSENAAPQVAVESESPVLPNPQARPISEPGTESEPSISVDPAQPMSPETVDAGAFGAPQVETEIAAPSVSQDSAPSQTAPAQNSAAVEDAAPEVDVAPAEQITPPEPTQEPAAEPVEKPTEDAPVVTAEVTADPTDETPAETDSFLKPVTGFDESFEQRTSSRLPTVGGDEEADAAPDAEDTAPEEAADPSPLAAFAAPFEGEDGKPLMSIVLLDDPSADAYDISTLEAFPLPLSIAIPATSPSAKARAQELRDAGFEVLALVDLPAGATASDIEINLTAQLGNVPEAVAVMDGLNGGLQETRPIADQVIASILNSGHGLVFQPKGLNTSQKLALRDGVPSVTIFRDFDGAGQTEVVIRRFMDQAAFKARQNEAVLMMGRLQEGTIAALASWALQDRASTVSVAPASALLLSVK